MAFFFITEDGYLMLTVARNIAVGNGMSVSDGAIQTNGVQPLATYLFTIPYLLTDGDKRISLIGVHLIATAAAFATIFAIRSFASRITSSCLPGTIWPWAVALLWFLGPLLVRHSMNALETGLYTFFILANLLFFARVLEPNANQKARLSLGLVCGLSILARNDAVFLVTAVYAAWATWEFRLAGLDVRSVVTRLVPAGLVTVFVASPWLLNNLVRFGSIVPISGTAQSLNVGIGSNLSLLPIVVFENAFPMFPVPSSLNETFLLPSLLSIAAVTVGLFWHVNRNCDVTTKYLVATYAIFALALASYYGLFFGAPHFLSRYMAPTAPLLIVASLVTATQVGRYLKLRVHLEKTFVLVGLTLSISILLFKTLPGKTIQGHEQVINWVNTNVENESWVAAVQTGTLGYWHDRTYNLDGKVNPAALTAIKTQGHVLDYVTKTEIDYIVDWWGIGKWVELPEAQGNFSNTFKRVVYDKSTNLSVLVRR